MWGKCVWYWILMLIYGTGAAVTPTPVNLPKGSSYFVAAKALTPVADAMRVGIDLGKATDEMRTAVIYGKLKLSDIGDIKVEICRNEADCVPMSYDGGAYINRDAYGIGFEAAGSNLRHSSFKGVRVSVDRPLSQVKINWSNYVQ